MCIINEEVDDVNSTQIYASLDKSGKRQLTIYSNKIVTEKDNAMILPVPNPQSVSFVDLSDYTSIFDDFQRSFIKRLTLSNTSKSRGFPSMNCVNDTLAVHNVGSYQASIVPSLSDFNKLDKSIFTINPEVFTILQKNYSSTFGYIVCKLKKGTHAYHPFAYTHDTYMIENQFSLMDLFYNKQKKPLLFIPTRHYHTHVHFSHKNNNSEFVDDWDHIIYTSNANLHTSARNNAIGSSDNNYDYINSKNVKWDKLPEEYRWAAMTPLTCWDKHGVYINDDLWAHRLSNSPTSYKTPSPADEL